MVRNIVKKISKGSRFNQIYLKKNEGIGFEPYQEVLITPLQDVIRSEPTVFQYNIKLDTIKKEIVKSIFKIIIDNITSGNILITGSFLNKGFNFNDIDILIIDGKKVNKGILKRKIIESIGIRPHIIEISMKNLIIGINRDPLFLLMVDRYVSNQRLIFKKKRDINYRLLDAYLVRCKNLVDGFDAYSIEQRKKILRDFISIKLFVEKKELTLKNIELEVNKIFGRKTMDKMINFGDKYAELKFIKKFKRYYNNLEKNIISNAAK